MTKIDAHDFAVISFNEICSNQYNYLVGELSGRGYSSLAYKARFDQDPTNCYWYGNAVFVKGIGVGGFNGETKPSYVADPFLANPYSPEKRGQVCRRVQVPGASYVGCSMHLEYREDSTAHAQSLEALNNLELAYGGYARIQGGDWNLEYYDSEMGSSWYARYAEADDCGGPPDVCNEATEGGVKIDYLFADRVSSDRVSGDAVSSDGWSDHQHLYGTFLIHSK